MKRLYIPLVIIGNMVMAQSPKEHLSGFVMSSVTYKHNPQWSAYLELQARSIEEYSKFDYYEIKGGVGYQLNAKNQVLLGVGRYGTYRESKIFQKELRVWAQYILSHYIASLKVDHRIRLEKRYYTFPQSSTHDRDERFRYRCLLTLPLGKDRLAPKTFFVNAYDEVFFTLEDPVFRRNRVFGGVGYLFNQAVNVNLGYLWQREFSLNGNRNLHFLYMGLNFSIDRMKIHDSYSTLPAD